MFSRCLRRDVDGCHGGPCAPHRENALLRALLCVSVTSMKRYSTSSASRPRTTKSCAWGRAGEAGRPSIRALCPQRGRRSMQYAGCVAISVTMVGATASRNALTPLLVARSRASLLRGGQCRRVKHRLIAPERIQDATQASRQGDDRNASTASTGQSLDPGA